MAGNRNAARTPSGGNAKLAGGRGGATQAARIRSTTTTSVSSSKKVAAGGAKVTTAVTGGHHSASKEPERVAVQVDPTTALGISFAVGGVVRQVQPKGQAAAVGVREGWRLTDIGNNDLTVTETSTPKCILAALDTARKKGKTYTIRFSTGLAGEPRRESQEEGKSDCGAGDGSSGDSSGDGASGVVVKAGEMSGGETSSGDRGGAECLERVSAGVALGEDGGEGGGGGGEGESIQGGERVPHDQAAPGRGNGEATLMYEMYSERFAIKDGRISSADIDETYCLSFVMPNCTLHLGPLSPTDRYAREKDGASVPYLKEDPPGTFHGLVDGGVYWVYVSRDGEEEKRDRERMKQVVQGMQRDLAGGESGGERKDDGRNGLESCSCVYGNPCVDEYGCKNWHSRYAVAKANGWKGF